MCKPKQQSSTLLGIRPDQHRRIKELSYELRTPMTVVVELLLERYCQTHTKPSRCERDRLVRVCTAAIAHDPRLSKDVVSLLA
jgi:hypothetical protein